MEYPRSTRSSVIPLFKRSRSSLDLESPGLPDALRNEAERCFRLARHPPASNLPTNWKLEAIGRAFESEVEKLEVAPHRWSLSRRAE